MATVVHAAAAAGLGGEEERRGACMGWHMASRLASPRGWITTTSRDRRKLQQPTAASATRRIVNLRRPYQLVTINQPNSSTAATVDPSSRRRRSIVLLAIKTSQLAIHRHSTDSKPNRLISVWGESEKTSRLATGLDIAKGCYGQATDTRAHGRHEKISLLLRIKRQFENRTALELSQLKIPCWRLTVS